MQYPFVVPWFAITNDLKSWINLHSFVFCSVGQTMEVLLVSFSFCYHENCSTHTMVCLNIQPTTRTPSRSVQCLNLWRMPMNGTNFNMLWNASHVDNCYIKLHCQSSLFWRNFNSSASQGVKISLWSYIILKKSMSVC